MPPPPPPNVKPSDPRTDLTIDAALRAFIEAAKTSRRGMSGEPMPEAQVAAWSCLLSEIDRFVSRPAKQCAPLDVAQARVVIESELEFDV